MKARTPFLFGVDVEEPVVAGSRGAVPLEQLVDIYLELLAEIGGRGTFFILGEIARRYPALVARVVAQGHEIACHSDRHIPLDQLKPEEFRTDLRRNLAALRDAGARDVIGYRAPSFSLIAATDWAYKIMAEEGITYSSSVLPALNPLYGWAGFGRAPKVIDGVLELPMTLLASRALQLPAAGGVYFRTLPWFIVKRSLRRLRDQGDPVLGYFHPYDVDCAQTYGTFPGFSRRSAASGLLFYNRRATLPRLRQLMAMGFSFEAYRSRLPSMDQTRGEKYASSSPTASQGIGEEIDRNQPSPGFEALVVSEI